TAARMSRARGPPELERAQHHERARAEDQDQQQCVFVQHRAAPTASRSTGERSASERYAASTIARSARPAAPSISAAIPRVIASRNALSIASYPLTSRRKRRNRVPPSPLTSTKRPRLSARQLPSVPVTVDHWSRASPRAPSEFET